MWGTERREKQPGDVPTANESRQNAARTSSELVPFGVRCVSHRVSRENEQSWPPDTKKRL